MEYVIMKEDTNKMNCLKHALKFLLKHDIYKHLLSTTLAKENYMVTSKINEAEKYSVCISFLRLL